MKWDNKGHQFDKWIAAWGFNLNYYIWGAATSGIHLYQVYGGKLKVKAFIDSDRNKQGKTIHEIEIKDFSGISLKTNEKIIVASYNYQEIAQILIGMGYRENIDFCESGQFIALHKWFDEREIYIKRVDQSVTTKCTLSCTKCNMWTPLYQHTYHKPLSMLKDDIDMLFHWVSCVERFYLLGGEVMIYPQLDEIIEYIGCRYRDKIMKLQIFTNGTVMPRESTIALMKKYKMDMIISDYSDSLPKLSANIEHIAEEMNENRIECHIEKYDSWLDFGNPLSQEVKQEWQTMERFETCKISWRGLENGKLYFCHSDCSAKRAGLIKDVDSDYFDLRNYEPDRRVELLEFSLGYNERGYLELCRTCWGEGGNGRLIPVAEQKH